MKTEILKVDPQFPDIKKISHCANIIRMGGLVVFPTDTVYGIAADFSNTEAIKRLRSIKKREEGKPFSVLISQAGLISNYTSFNEPSLYKLIHKYWPGPLTIVVPSREEGQTIGVRMPDNMIALKLVQEAQRTVAAPSANIQGNNPPSTCDEALRDFDGLVDIAIDGGPARIGAGSSVVDLTKDKPAILRQCVITKEDVDKVIGRKTVLFICTGNSCRSVMAEYLMKNMLTERDDVEVLSAGTGVFLHSTASSETISVLKEKGINAENHYSKSINSIILKKSDLIFVMTKAHRTQVLERVPEVEKRIYLLREFSSSTLNTQEDLDIPDPIGRSHQEYKECLSIIKDSLDKIIKLV